MKGAILWPTEHPYVIIDEVGSTPRDEELREKRDNQEIDGLEYKTRLLRNRQFLFTKQVIYHQHSQWLENVNRSKRLKNISRLKRTIQINSAD